MSSPGASSHRRRTAASFFYDAHERSGEVWATNGTGLAGNAPRHTFTHDAGASFTHVACRRFSLDARLHRQSSDVERPLLLRRPARDMARCTDATAPPTAASCSRRRPQADTLPRHASSVIAGNFGGLGNTDRRVLQRIDGDRDASLHSRTPATPTADIVVRETQSGLRRSPTTIAVAGNFWMANEEDHWFNDGPPVSSPPQFDPDWRFGTGTFSDLLIYERVAGLGEFYFHEPLGPPPEPLEGYITSTTSHKGLPAISTGSVLPGETIAFHVSSQHGPYTITIYRQGSEHGKFDKRWRRSKDCRAIRRRFRSRATHIATARSGRAVATFVIPDWPSGFYVARVRTRNSPFHTVDLPFVGPCAVRSDERRAARARRRELVRVQRLGRPQFVLSSHRSRLRRCVSEHVGVADSIRLPAIVRAAVARRLRQFAADVGNPFVRWLARMGIAVDVCTSRDMHFDSPSTREYRLLLFVGHPEYWSAQMRTNVESFAKAGGNVAFFGGNIAWWQIRISDDGRQLTCYKVAGFDPVSTTPDHALTTVHWFDDLVKRPETKLTGVSWLGDNGLFYDQDHRYTVKRTDHWVFAGTDLRNGDKFGGYSSKHDGVEDSSVAGAETDRVQTNGPNGLRSPAGYTLASIFDLQSPSFEVGTMGIFRPKSGAGEVFNAATNNWALGLNIDRPHWNVIDQITHNVVTRLGWGLSSVSQGKSIPGGPVSAVLIAPDRIAVFLADDQGGVYTSVGHPDRGWAPWTSVSGGKTCRADTSLRYSPQANRITLFLTDPQGGIYTTSGNGKGWEPWTSVSGGVTMPGGRITAVLTAPNRLTLFVANPKATSSRHRAMRQTWAQWTTVSEGSARPADTSLRSHLSESRNTLSRRITGRRFHNVGQWDRWAAWNSVSEGSARRADTSAAVSPPRIAWLSFLPIPEAVFTRSRAMGKIGSGGPACRRLDHAWRTDQCGVTAAKRMTLFLADPGGGIYTNSGIENDWAGWTSVSHARTTPGAPIFALSMPSRKVRLILADWTGRIYTTTSDMPLT